MNILGTGIDIVEIPRFREILARQGDGFLRRVFTAAEREYCAARKHDAQHFAARFAAKEAVAKAFGTGIGAAMAFAEIEIVSTENGAPKVVLHGSARETAQQLEVSAVLVSLTHTDGYAAANAVVVTRRGGP